MASMSMVQRSRRNKNILPLVLLVASGSLVSIIKAFVAPLGLQLNTRGSGTSSVIRPAAASLYSLDNPVRTVSETVADFYKNYPQPPMLPMYKPFVIDLLKQTHLAMQDSRFKYDAVFALGLREYFTGMMGSYDKLTGSKQSDLIWQAFLQATGLEVEKVNADAEAVAAAAKSSTPMQLLEAMHSGAAGAFENVASGLHSTLFSVGLFKVMELSGVEITKNNAEEWAKELKIPVSRVTTDLATYNMNKDKLKQGEEMLREIEIREKKALAARLEEKAKALAAKAEAAKAETSAATPDATVA